MFKRELEELGLAEKEAAVYLALLQAEQSSVIELSQKTAIKRPTVYVAIEALKKRGLATETQVGKKTYYRAEPPERLETFVERQRLTLDERAKRLKDLVPQLKSMQRESSARPIVTYYEGKEGIISSYEDFFEKEDTAEGTAYVIYPRDLLQELFTEEERKKYKAVRINRRITTKALYTSATEYPSDSTGERIRLNDQKHPILCDITIFKDKVKIHTLGKSIAGISITAKDVADTLRTIFELAFKEAKKESGDGK